MNFCHCFFNNASSRFAACSAFAAFAAFACSAASFAAFSCALILFCAFFASFLDIGFPVLGFLIGFPLLLQLRFFLRAALVTAAACSLDAPWSV